MFLSPAEALLLLAHMLIETCACCKPGIHGKKPMPLRRGGGIYIEGAGHGQGKQAAAAAPGWRSGCKLHSDCTGLLRPEF